MGVDCGLRGRCRATSAGGLQLGGSRAKGQSDPAGRRALEGGLAEKQVWKTEVTIAAKVPRYSFFLHASPPRHCARMGATFTVFVLSLPGAFQAQPLRRCGQTGCQRSSPRGTRRLGLFLADRWCARVIGHVAVGVCAALCADGQAWPTARGWKQQLGPPTVVKAHAFDDRRRGRFFLRRCRLLLRWSCFQRRNDAGSGGSPASVGKTRWDFTKDRHSCITLPGNGFADDSGHAHQPYAGGAQARGGGRVRCR